MFSDTDVLFGLPSPYGVVVLFLESITSTWMSPSSSRWARCQTRYVAVPLISLRLEHDLYPELPAVSIPPCPEPALSPVHFPSLKFEPTRLIRLRRY
jgi:hypothetical protein